jgi:hypothetical protein
MSRIVRKLVARFRTARPARRRDAPAAVGCESLEGRQLLAARALGAHATAALLRAQVTGGHRAAHVAQPTAGAHRLGGMASFGRVQSLLASELSLGSDSVAAPQTQPSTSPFQFRNPLALNGAMLRSLAGGAAATPQGSPTSPATAPTTSTTPAPATPTGMMATVNTTATPTGTMATINATQVVPVTPPSPTGPPSASDPTLATPTLLPAPVPTGQATPTAPSQPDAPSPFGPLILPKSVPMMGSSTQGGPASPLGIGQGLMPGPGMMGTVFWSGPGGPDRGAGPAGAPGLIGLTGGATAPNTTVVTATAPGTSSPGAPATPAALQQAQQTLSGDIDALLSKSQVTQAQEFALRKDMEAVVASLTQKPDDSKLTTLQNDLSAAFKSGTITDAVLGQLRQDQAAVLLSAGASQDAIDKVQADQGAIRKASGVTDADLQKIVGDVKAVQSASGSMQGDGVGLSPLGPDLGPGLGGLI